MPEREIPGFRIVVLLSSGRHPVSGTHPRVDQQLLDPADHVVQLGPGQLDGLAVLAAEDERGVR